MVCSYLRFKVFPLVIFMALLCFFYSCNGEPQKNERKHQAADLQEIKDSQVFLTYVDSVAHFPLAKFGEANLNALNHKFSDHLPLMMHHPSKEDDGKNIVIQLYHNNGATDTIKAGAIFLVPKSISDSLNVEDFIRYFGKLKTEKPLIGVTSQPLPVMLDLFPGTSLKLTFNDNKDIAKAKVVTVEVLKFR